MFRKIRKDKSYGFITYVSLSDLYVRILFFKVRKPYTATKQREKWSEEEHERFLEAIKLYGRGWRQIQGILIAAYFCFDATQLFSYM